VASQVAHTIQAFGFATFDDETSYTTTINGGRICTEIAGTSCFFEAALFLPAGALIEAIEGEFCDSDAAANVTATLFKAPVGGPVESLATATTSLAGTPGCVFPFAPLAVPETVDNFGASYFVQVRSGASNMVQFNSVRILYRLQVSPAPAVATFSDVPTGHPYFRFVEALVASGITAGCGGGLYCVNASITRGEMAVFLAVALGLHFAP
jgi:hypothetical protein